MNAAKISVSPCPDDPKSWAVGHYSKDGAMIEKAIFSGPNAERQACQFALFEYNAKLYEMSEGEIDAKTKRMWDCLSFLKFDGAISQDLFDTVGKETIEWNLRKKRELGFLPPLSTP
jgi:hypothetical protein